MKGKIIFLPIKDPVPGKTWGFHPEIGAHIIYEPNITAGKIEQVPLSSLLWPHVEYFDQKAFDQECRDCDSVNHPYRHTRAEYTQMIPVTPACIELAIVACYTGNADCTVEINYDPNDTWATIVPQTPFETLEDIVVTCVSKWTNLKEPTAGVLCKMIIEMADEAKLTVTKK